MAMEDFKYLVMDRPLFCITVVLVGLGVLVLDVLVVNEFYKAAVRTGLSSETVLHGLSVVFVLAITGFYVLFSLHYYENPPAEDEY